MIGDRVPKWKLLEWDRIRSRRSRAFGDDAAQPADSSTKDTKPENLVGLSLSGGGIRSAIYNDGFLQGLSHRGFLRYVDYLCSVSGGGYIAGHLISQARKSGDREGKCFHDDDQADRPNLGRDPITGKINASRLGGVGGYLSRTMDFLPAYLWSFFFSFAFYIGIVGIVATIAALFWRSFDDPVFRDLYFGTLGLTKGNELTVAFIPTVLLIVLATASEVGLSIWRMCFGFEMPAARKIHLIVRKVSLVSITLAILTSLAIFLGNGKTAVSSNASGDLLLNHYAQFLAITAGIIQVLVFFGRDRLFRSERAEAKQWQKHLQRGVTTAVLLFLIFSMVHWMGREDISGYTQNRDPHLVRGDVTNWYVMDQMFASYEEYKKAIEASNDKSDDNNDTPKEDQDTRERDNEAGTATRQEVSSEVKSLNPNDEVPNFAISHSRWIESLAAGRAGLRLYSWKPGRGDLSHPPSPLQPSAGEADASVVWPLPTRIWGACYAYWLVMFESNEAEILALRETLREEQRDPDKRSASDAGNVTLDGDDYVPFKRKPNQKADDPNQKTDDPDQSTCDLVAYAFTNLHIAIRIQNKKLRPWNGYLEDRDFTSFLIDTSPEDTKPEDTNPEDAKPEDAKPEDAKLLELAREDDAGKQEQKPIARPSDFLSIPVSILTLAAATDAELTDAQRTSLLNEVRRRQLLIKQTSERDELASERLTRATVNRLLLEALLPGAVQQQLVPSTLVVPPHDQQARRRWLGIWMFLTLIGMIGGLGQNHIATVFQFYRQQLGNNFLVATHDGEKFCDEPLHKLRPTDDGLPYPLFLAATLEPTTSNGSYQVDAKPFVFSPQFCGQFETDDGLIPSKQLSFSSNPASDAVSLGDAITLSGAAVTPLMTHNRWLSIILDFFNTGIGQRLRRLDRTGTEVRQLWTRPIVVSALLIVGAMFAAYELVGFEPPMILVTGLLVSLGCYCILLRVGSPGLIYSLIFPRDCDTKRERDHDRSFYVADGGFYDYLGVSELLRRRCELIVVSDTGANIGNDPLGTLAQMCEKASQELGVRFLDLDHEAPIDFGRLKQTEQRLVHQPYLCMRIRYPAEETPDAHDPASKHSNGHAGTQPREGRLFYCQMSITDNDPIEIQHIRNRFPSFPDEPTVNQFYTEEQVSAYRALGYHIANRLCNELQSWHSKVHDDEAISNDGSSGGGGSTPDRRPSDDSPTPPSDQAALSKEPAEEYRNSLVAGDASQQAHAESLSGKGQGQPLFSVLMERLLTAYRLACYEELSYRKDDIFSEAIWVSKTFAFPAFRRSVQRVMSVNSRESISQDLSRRWLREYEYSADLRSAYRTAVIRDINELNRNIDCFCEVLWSAIGEIMGAIASNSAPPDQCRQRLAAHLTNIATACQEVHSGRPHSTFQIGGRDKLVQLCESFSSVICEGLMYTPRNEAPEGNAASKLFENMNRVIAELIELERAVFQGGEHVTTISFAQCMSTMWGRIAQSHDSASGLLDDKIKGLLPTIVQELNPMPRDKTTNGTPSATQFATDFQVTELRHKLDVGLKRTRVRLIRDALVKCWCIGYFEAEQIQAGFDFDDRLAAKSVRKNAPSKSRTTKKRGR